MPGRMPGILRTSGYSSAKLQQPAEPRYKANMSLWKNTKYRFTLCNSDDSEGKLILNLKDDSNKIVASSYDQKTGKTYAFIDFLCSKSGIYQLNYDFAGGQPGIWSWSSLPDQIVRSLSGKDLYNSRQYKKQGEKNLRDQAFSS